jgi:hypothetical protein
MVGAWLDGVCAVGSLASPGDSLPPPPSSCSPLPLLATASARPVPDLLRAMMTESGCFEDRIPGGGWRGVALSVGETVGVSAMGGGCTRDAQLITRGRDAQFFG